ncbi:MAG: sulfotransferase [Pseudomonadota bacterium]
MPPTETRTIPLDEAVTLAGRLYAEGRYPAAGKVLQKLVPAMPQNGFVRHLAGLVAAAQGDAAQAQADLEAAMALDPQNGQISSNATEALRSVRALDAAIAAGKRATQTAPGAAAAWCNLGLAHYDSGDLEAAEACQHTAIEIDPRHANALNNLGSIARDQERTEDAIAFYARAIEADPNPVQPLSNIAIAHLQNVDVEAARTALTRLFSIDPDHGIGQATMANVFLIDNDLDSAERAARRAMEQAPEVPDGAIALAQTLIEKNRPGMALDVISKALEIDPENTNALKVLGSCHSDLGDVDAANAALVRALALRPGFTFAKLALGHLKMELGEMDTARALFAEALAERPDDQGVLCACAQSETITDPASPILTSLRALVPDAETAPATRRPPLYYGLAKCEEDLGNYAAAFEHYRSGAAAKRALVSFDADAYDAMIDGLIAATPKSRLEDIRASAAIDGGHPIFVLGMPRSGTTLTETILSRHSRVHAAGELNDLTRIYGFRTQGTEMGFPKPFDAISAGEFRRATTMYLDRIRALAPDSPRITDKMPVNYVMLGVIWATMPGARVIYTKRNPMDVCLSNFTRLFERSQPHSYDLHEMGRVHAAHVRIMEHWGRVLPEDAFMTLPYDELVEDTEGWTRKMLDHCGLDWDPACLSSHEAKRRVRTASILQVREKIYTTSREKWRRYADELEPLRAQLAAAGVIET